MDIKKLLLGQLDDEINKEAAKKEKNKVNEDIKYYTFGEYEEKQYEEVSFEDLVRNYKKDVLKGMSDENLASVHLEIVKNIGLSNYEKYFDEFKDSLDQVKKNKDKVITEIMNNIADEYLMKKAFKVKDLWKIVSVDGKDFIVRMTSNEYRPEDAPKILSSLGVYTDKGNGSIDLESRSEEVNKKIDTFFDDFQFKYAFKNNKRDIPKLAYLQFKDDEDVLYNLPRKFVENFGYDY